MRRSVVLRISTAVVVIISAGVAVVASGLSARANDGDALILGRVNTATGITEVNDQGSGSVAIYGAGAGNASDGVEGYGTDTGVVGTGGPTGVFGNGSANGVWGVSDGGTGVYGNTAPLALRTECTGTRITRTAAESTARTTGQAMGRPGSRRMRVEELASSVMSTAPTVLELRLITPAGGPPCV
jgi:hypothetical protein